jgi:ATP-dependent Clp protease ATP-binding subunit ClpB
LSQFGAEKFTTRSREVIEAAQLSATKAGNTQTEPIHLLVALLRQEEGTAKSLVTKSGVEVGSLTATAERVQGALPTASGQTVQQPAASASLTRVLAAALDLASSMKDDYVATEHLLIGLATVESSAQQVLLDAGLSADGLREGLTAVRGNRRVTSPEAESTYEALEKFSVDLTAAAEDGKLDPGDRARRRDPPSHPGAVAAYQEQPGPDRRARASARPPSSKGSPSASSRATCPTR